MEKRRIIISIIEIIIGTLLTIGTIPGIVDEFWSGMGTAMLIIGLVNFTRCIKYNTNIEYRKKCDIDRNDERNKFISQKAWAWAGYSFVLLASSASIILKIAKRDDLMLMTSSFVCIIILLYWVFYYLLRKKY